MARILITPAFLMIILASCIPRADASERIFSGGWVIESCNAPGASAAYVSCSSFVMGIFLSAVNNAPVHDLENLGGNKGILIAQDFCIPDNAVVTPNLLASTVAAWGGNNKVHTLPAVSVVMLALSETFPCR